jgi:hypothetical protein
VTSRSHQPCTHPCPMRGESVDLGQHRKEEQAGGRVGKCSIGTEMRHGAKTAATAILSPEMSAQTLRGRKIGPHDTIGPSRNLYQSRSG